MSDKDTLRLGPRATGRKIEVRLSLGNDTHNGDIVVSRTFQWEDKDGLACFGWCVGTAIGCAVKSLEASLSPQDMQALAESLLEMMQEHLDG